MSDTSLAQDYRKADWALVTGASDGIGRALAIEAAKAGYNVILSGRRVDRLEMLAESLRRANYVAWGASGPSATPKAGAGKPRRSWSM
jgi:NADP-dependent 3-hydroxy acid dehydrogenase YdfG